LRPLETPHLKILNKIAPAIKKARRAGHIKPIA